jgi:cation diffusion facilitator family transporter
MVEATHAKKIRFRAILFAFVSGLLILGLKFYAAKISDSSALRSDALEGTVNVLAAAFGLISILFSDRPADRDHPYGHGKMEYFASVFEGGLIFLAGFLILIDTIHRFTAHAPLGQLNFGLVLNLIAGAGNGVVAVIIYSAGKKYDSLVLKADGIHLFTDLITTAALGVGLGIVLFTGWDWIDPLLALGVAALLFKTGFSLVSEASGALLDAENPELLKKIVAHLNQRDLGRIITVHELRAQEFGRDKHVDIHLVVPEFLTVKDAHLETDKIADELQELLGPESQIHTHVDPCQKLYCRECSMENCPIRRAEFVAKASLTVESAVKAGPV